MTCEYVMHSYLLVHMCSFIFVTWLIDMYDTTQSCVWHVSFTFVLCETCESRHAFICVRSYVSHDSFICMTWLIYKCDMTHPYVWHDSSICVTRLNHMCAMTHSHVYCVRRGCHVTYTMKSGHTNERAMQHTWMSHVTHEWVMSHLWWSHVAHVQPTSELTYIRVYIHVHTLQWLNHVTQMKDSRIKCGKVMSHIYSLLLNWLL